ncbi:concanavalin A-like lectin/glucanase domain-containing protein [Neocallimastix lanati (nom. inval.)]|nr:concanavalin A-like lectin/glucanase domain-containing protein [Neocallimastix sp. JGI-2020a]
MKLLKFIPFVLTLVTSSFAQSFCSSTKHTGVSVKETKSKKGKIGGVNYELWTDGGNNGAAFYSDGSFSCSFQNTKDYLCRSGLSFDIVKQNIRNVDYSYVDVYGWSRSPLVEFYIVDNWLRHNRPGGWVVYQ